MSEWKPIDAPEGQWSVVDTDTGDAWGSVVNDSDCGEWSELPGDGDCNDFDNWLCWILDTGKWSDACFWRDLSLWDDGVRDYEPVAA